MSIRDPAARARSQELARLFRQPASAAQRHFEICRAYFLEHTPADELAQRFQLHVGTVRAVVRDFARNPDVDAFFSATRPGRETSPKRDALHDHARDLRRQGLTLADSRARLDREGHVVSESYPFRVLQRAGLATTRRHCPPRQPGERANDGSTVPAVAAVQALALQEGRRLTSQVAGLFPFLPQLLDLDLPRAVGHAGLPGSEHIPPPRAPLALLAPKPLGKRRASHVGDPSHDEGAGPFAGLDVLPKITRATDYSYKTERVMNERPTAAVTAKAPPGDPPPSFDLDFHATPFRGAQPDLENQRVPPRNRAPPAVMAFVAPAAGRRVPCYATANVPRAEADGMAPKFAAYRKEQAGHYPARLVFDARATTYAGPNQPTQHRVGFITIRRRGRGMPARVKRRPAGSWRCRQIGRAKEKRRQVRHVDERVHLDGGRGTARQPIVTGSGHESPTFFPTNDHPQVRTARAVIQTYASRNHVENRPGEQITFFHLDCPCSDVRPNVDFDLTLTALADLLYRGLASRPKGFGRASPSTAFREFVDAAGAIEVTAEGLVVRPSKRAHKPPPKEAGLAQPTRTVPRLGGRGVRRECP